MKFSICFSKKSGFQLLVNQKKRHGLAKELCFKCVHCFTILGFEASTKIGNRVFEVNRRATLACNSVKGGRQTLANFCGIMNLPPPVTCRAFSNDLKMSSGAAREKANEIMLQASVLSLLKCYHFSANNAIIIGMTLVTAKLIET